MVLSSFIDADGRTKVKVVSGVHQAMKQQGEGKLLLAELNYVVLFAHKGFFDCKGFFF